MLPLPTQLIDKTDEIRKRLCNERDYGVKVPRIKFLSLIIAKGLNRLEDELDTKKRK